MYDDKYEKEVKFIEKSEEEKEIELMTSIIKVKQELDTANKNFEYAGGDLIDYYTYQIKANCAKFDYLVKRAKEKGLCLDMIEQIDIKFNKAI